VCGYGVSLVASRGLTYLLKLFYPNYTSFWPICLYGGLPMTMQLFLSIDIFSFSFSFSFRCHLVG
jgi:hypothetical protein